MECVPRHNTIDCPTLYWAAIPGNAADFPAEESFHTFNHIRGFEYTAKNYLGNTEQAKIFMEMGGDINCNVADWYTNNGSLYMTSLAFLPLGLPAAHPFWTDAAQEIEKALA